ncbi:alpha-L-fucosidase [Granulicella pectinivorans]|jgi:alpha-L-fucosidase|uniref:alpha-L-fucosidase n=1 Tax=Granulicella pectinivorans TaxID=474950 RepID=A0A1I6LWI9_9BACT|nr:alpha-L-fucosidase [Granulicella pectinivorans]SFS07796.1 alpha-L-fucosidase [Granulicella pectinivorans]
MSITRRHTLKLLTGAAAATLAPRTLLGQQITKGPFTAENLKTYETPAWFTEAKFGIWSHWGPQSGVEKGDWYARNMYIQGSKQYEYEVATYGHPSKEGYKKHIPTFKGAKWDPEHLMDLYKAAGAKYFVSMGVHHDNFDMWNSKYQPRWNAVANGPKRDIVGEYAKAARARGLRFGVSEHLSNSFDWLAVSHLSDSTGPLAGVSYDGVDPAYADLYHDLSGMTLEEIKGLKAMGRVAPDRWKKQYFNRIKDLVDQHSPDLLYTDGGIPFDVYGNSLVAEVYNVSANLHKGRTEAIYNGKEPEQCEVGTCTLDRERGVADGIAPKPWQTDTCIGQWHYNRGIKYKTSAKVIELLTDIVSKNGNLLLNFPLPNSGELDPDEMVTLNGITKWMQVNSEGIYGTRPFTVYGEGPSTKVNAGNGGFNEDKRPPFGTEDIRFTTKGKTLYAFVFGPPTSDILIKSLGTGPKVKSVRILGYSEAVKFTQSSAGLKASVPSKPISEIALTYKIELA